MNPNRVATVFAEFGAARPVLGIGSSGTDVSDLQEMLNALGARIAMDGIFGPETERAVKEYQTKNGLPASGVVDASTWNSLGQVSSGGVDVKVGPIQILSRTSAGSDSLSPLLLLAGAAAGAYYLFFSDGKKKQKKRRR